MSLIVVRSRVGGIVDFERKMLYQRKYGISSNGLQSVNIMTVMMMMIMMMIMMMMLIIIIINS